MIYRAINGLIRHAIEADLITNDDIFVVRNQLMDILKLTDWNDKEPLTGNIEELLEPLIDYAVKAGIIEDTSVQRDLFDTRVMGVFTPMPREVNATFQRKYSASPSAATEWYYAFSKSLNYVRAERIAKDLKWTCKYLIVPGFLHSDFQDTGFLHLVSLYLGHLHFDLFQTAF